MAVGLAIKQAVQTVLTEVLTNHDLQEQLRRASMDDDAEEKSSGSKSLPQRLWEAAAQGVRQTVRTVKQGGHRVGLALFAVGSVVAGVAYAARRRLVSVGAAIYQGGKRLFGGAVSALTRMLPKCMFGVI